MAEGLDEFYAVQRYGRPPTIPFECKVVTSGISSATDQLDVREVSGNKMIHRNVKWIPKIISANEQPRYPKKDDKALVLLADNGQPWVVEWSPTGSGIPAGPVGSAGNDLSGTYPSPQVDRVSFKDTRGIATHPSNYNQKGEFHFKSRSSVGNPGLNGSFAQLIGLHGWGDDTGGRAHELAFTDDGIYHRDGTEATGWNAWKKLLEGDPEPRHVVGAVGEPAFQNGWTNFGGDVNASFYKDRGRVYLEGVVKNGTAQIVFTLPVGYRPPVSAPRFVIESYSTSPIAAFVFVRSTGTVEVHGGGNTYYDLSPVNFRVE